MQGLEKLIKSGVLKDGKAIILNSRPLSSPRIFGKLIEIWHTLKMLKKVTTIHEKTGEEVLQSLYYLCSKSIDLVTQSDNYIDLVHAIREVSQEKAGVVQPNIAPLMNGFMKYKEDFCEKDYIIKEPINIGKNYKLTGMLFNVNLDYAYQSFSSEHLIRINKEIIDLVNKDYVIMGEAYINNDASTIRLHFNYHDIEFELFSDNLGSKFGEGSLMTAKFANILYDANHKIVAYQIGTISGNKPPVGIPIKYEDGTVLIQNTK